MIADSLKRACQAQQTLCKNLPGPFLAFLSSMMSVFFFAAVLNPAILKRPRDRYFALTTWSFPHTFFHSDSMQQWLRIDKKKLLKIPQKISNSKFFIKLFT
jgi:hypothetical protein